METDFIFWKIASNDVSSKQLTCLLQVLRALDIDVSEGKRAELLAMLDENGDGAVDKDELKKALRRQCLYHIEDGRFYVLVSLREAEVISVCTSFCRKIYFGIKSAAVLKSLRSITHH